MCIRDRSKTGKTFYGCEHNPTCNFMTWDEPLKETCPQCGTTLLRKKGKGAKIYCPKENCGFEKPVTKNSGVQEDA